MVKLPALLGSKVKALVCAVLVAWMLFYWFQTAVDMKNQFTGYPFMDSWIAAIKQPSYEKFDFSVLGEQHNEHRVVVPEFTFAVDDLLFGARALFPVSLNVILQLLTFTAFAWVMWADKLLSRYLRLAAIAMGGIVLGWPGISYVLSYSFVLQWTIVQFMMCAALLLLIRKHIALTALCAVIATFSAGHGMLLWPLLLLFALILQIGWYRLAALFVTGAASILLYFHNLVGSNDAAARRFLHEPTWFAGFVVSMLSMPFGADRRILGLWVGSLSLVWFTTIVLIAWRKRLLTETPAVVLFGLCTFSLLTVLLCGVGRTLPEFWDYPTAKVARYLCVPICYWASLLMATFWVLARSRFHPAVAWAAVCLAAGAMAYQFPRITPWLNLQYDMYSRQQSAIVAIESGVACDSIVASDLFPNPQIVYQWDALLRQRHLSIYANSRFAWVSQPLSTLSALSSAKPAQGGVTTILPSACATQLAGWSEDAARDILLVNERGTVAGLARRLPAGLPLYLPNSWTKLSPRENWTGFVNPTVPSLTIQPYAISPDGHSVRQLGLPVPLTPPSTASIR